jgi:hypothetical protein
VPAWGGEAVGTGLEDPQFTLGEGPSRDAAVTGVRRIVIEQAKGVLAERRRISVDEAFTLLREHARDHHLRLSDVAREVAEGSTTASEPWRA